MSQNRPDWSTWTTSLMMPRIVCVAIAMSCLIIGGLMASGILGNLAPSASVMAYIFPAIGLVDLAASVFVPRLMPFPKISSPTKEVDGVFAKETVLADPKDARQKFIGAHFTRFVVRLALGEGAALFGLVGFVAFGTPLPISVGLCGIAFVATLIAFPRTSDWKMKAEMKLGARFPEE
ncbi:MAG: hypothetical protein AB8H86_33440 [Polyangiales bacterium]